MTVQLQHVTRAGRKVERIDVLRAKREVAKALFELRERSVPGIGPGPAVRRLAFVVPAPNQSRVAPKTFVGGQLFDAMRAP